MFLQILAKMFCGITDPDWVNELHSDIDNKDGPLLEEVCDVRDDYKPIEMMYVPKNISLLPERLEPLNVRCVRAKKINHIFGYVHTQTAVPDTAPMVERVAVDFVKSNTAIMFGSIEVEVADLQLLKPGNSTLLCNVPPEETKYSQPEVTGNANEPTAESPLNPIVARESPPEMEFKTYVKTLKEIAVDQHRRVNKHQAGQFVAALVAEIKTKLGLTVKSRANDLVIRHLAYSRCKEVGVRPKHAQEIVAKVCVMVYVPDGTDIDAKTLENSNANALKHAKLSYEKMSSIYRAWIPFTLHSKFTSGPTQAATSG
jgi:hypothetical protein